MAKARIGHFMEARILEALGVDYIDESEVLTPADEEHHIDKRDFKVPFVCGARNLGEALRRIAEGAAMIRTKGEAGSGNIVEAVRHIRTIVKEMKQLTVLGKEELVHEAKKLQAPLELVEWVAEHGKLPVPNFSAGGIATPADAALVMQLGAEAVFVGSGIFKSVRSGSARPRHREGRHVLQGSREAARSQRRAGRWPCPAWISPRSPKASCCKPEAGKWRRVDERNDRRPRAAGRFRSPRPRPSNALGAEPSTCAPPPISTAVDGLVIPGGESTTMLKLLHARKPARAAARTSAAASPSSAPAREPSCWPPTSRNPPQESLGLMDIDVERNAYGRQIDSRVAHLDARSRIRARARSPAKWKPSSSARPSSAASGRRRACWPRYRWRSGAGGARPPPGRHFPSGTHRRPPRSRAFLCKTVTANSKTRVLFVCIGNSCRSQMAEGFARAYGIGRDHCGQRRPGPRVHGSAGYHPRHG